MFFVALVKPKTTAGLQPEQDVVGCMLTVLQQKINIKNFFIFFKI